MATHAANPNYHGQLAAAVTDTITLEVGIAEYEIINADGTSRIDYTLDGSDPVVNGSLTGRVLPGVAVDTVYVKSDGTTVVKLKSAGTPRYSIQAVAGPDDA